MFKLCLLVSCPAATESVEKAFFICLYSPTESLDSINVYEYNVEYRLHSSLTIADQMLV